MFNKAICFDLVGRQQANTCNITYEREIRKCLCSLEIEIRFLQTDTSVYIIPYILESTSHPFYSFRGLKNQMRIRIAVDSWILEK
jgi:hypothetical protein